MGNLPGRSRRSLLFRFIPVPCPSRTKLTAFSARKGLFACLLTGGGCLGDCSFAGQLTEAAFVATLFNGSVDGTSL